MKKILITLYLLSVTSQAGLTSACELALTEATAIHWQYVIGKASPKEDANAIKRARKICKKSQPMTSKPTKRRGK